MRIGRTALILATLGVASGCYRYVPTDPVSIVPGANVQALLTAEGSAEMTRIFGPGTEAIEGPFAGWSGEGVSILRQVTMYQAGFPPTTLTDTLFLESRFIRQVGVQEVDTRKTVGFSLGVVGLGVGAIFAAQIFGGTRDQPGEGEPGEPPDDLLLFSIPIGFE